jgi:hypothetical protein
MVLVRTPTFLCVTFSRKTQSIADVNSWNVRRMYTLEGPELEVAPASVRRVSRVNRRSLHRLCRRLHCPRVSCSCLFYPSTFKETFGLVLAEANAVGTPVIKLAGPAHEHSRNPSQQCFPLCAVAS